MKYRNQVIEYSPRSMQFMILANEFSGKTYVSVASAKKAIDNYLEKKEKMAKAKAVVKKVSVFEVDSKYGSKDTEKYFVVGHTIKDYKADGVGRNREYFFVSTKKNDSYGSWRNNYETRFRADENGITRLYDVKDVAKVQKILDQRNELYRQKRELEDKIDALDDAESEYQLSKTALLAKMGLPTDL